MYCFGRNWIFDSVIKSEDLGENTITIDESFFTLAYECYKGEKLQDVCCKLKIPKVAKGNPQYCK